MDDEELGFLIRYQEQQQKIDSAYDTLKQVNKREMKNLQEAIMNQKEEQKEDEPCTLHWTDTNGANHDEDMSKSEADELFDKYDTIFPRVYIEMMKDKERE